jgi:DNA-binding MarR family transcriptional regulator
MATHENWPELKRIDRAIMQTSADGGRRRIEVAENVTLMTGIDLSASAIMVVEQLETKAMRVRDLATCVGVTSGAITRRIQDLEAKGLVERVADERDGRASVVRLSSKGTDVVRLATSLRECVLRHAFEDWGTSEIQTLLPAFERLAEGLYVNPFRDLIRRAAPDPTISVDEWIRRIEEA